MGVHQREHHAALWRRKRFHFTAHREIDRHEFNRKLTVQHDHDALRFEQFVQTLDQ